MSKLEDYGFSDPINHLIKYVKPYDTVIIEINYDELVILIEAMEAKFNQTGMHVKDSKIYERFLFELGVI